MKYLKKLEVTFNFVESTIADKSLDRSSFILEEDELKKGGNIILEVLYRYQALKAIQDQNLQ